MRIVTNWLFGSLLAWAFMACGKSGPKTTSVVSATRSSGVAGSWSLDTAGLHLAVDEAVERRDKDLAAKLAETAEKDRELAKTMGSLASMMLISIRDTRLEIEARSDGTFELTGGATPSSQETGSGTWVEKEGRVVFTVTKKNGVAIDGRESPMTFSWKDSDTLVMTVPNLDAGVPLKRK